MTGIVVKTVEELKAAQKKRAHPAIFIKGELAANLLASGIVTPVQEDRNSGWVVNGNGDSASAGPIKGVIDVLSGLSRSNRLEVINEGSVPTISFYPVQTPRRESN
ncbi:MAG: hypothetical protein V2B18_18390 [Pseudomonadota bacterium]